MAKIAFLFAFLVLQVAFCAEAEAEDDDLLGDLLGDLDDLGVEGDEADAPAGKKEKKECSPVEWEIPKDYSMGKVVKDCKNNEFCSLQSYNFCGGA